MVLRKFEARLNQVDLVLRRLDAGARFLSEGVQNVYHVAEFGGIDRPVGRSVAIFYDLHYRGAAETGESLGTPGSIAVLNVQQRSTKFIFHIIRQLP